jgi:lipopolysaccharide export LptBFGC system permease protein LptF
MSTAEPGDRSGTARGRAIARGGSPAILRRFLLGEILKRFAGGEAFLVGVMLLAELFTSMWRFLAMDAPIGSILLWLAAGVPAHALEVLPVAFLFGITLSLAEMHADGELIVVCGSGVSVQSLSLPILLFSVAISGAMLVANDAIAIPASARRDDLNQVLSGQKGQGRQVSDITIMAEGGAVVYRAGSYDPLAQRLSNVDIVERDASGRMVSRIQSPRAEWKRDRWTFPEARVFSLTPGGDWTERSERDFAPPELREDPSSFGVLRDKPSLMRLGELNAHIKTLRRSGLPSAEAETELNKRFSLLFTPVIVCGLSVAVAGLFRKNSLLMSLLFSLCTATVYYVAQMLGSLSAKTGWVSPAVGIWTVTAIFLTASAFGYAKAKT